MTYCDYCHHSKEDHEINYSKDLCHHQPFGSCNCRNFTDWDEWTPENEDD